MHLDHVGLSVGDLDSMARWYCATFDLRESTPFAIAPLGLRGTFVVSDDGWAIELLEREGSGAGLRAPDTATALLTRGYGHVCLRVPDVAQTHARAVASGAGERMAPQDAPEPGVRMSFLADPEGNLIELLDRAGPVGAREGGRGIAMTKSRFDEYIRRFNEEDDTAFDDFLAPDMRMRNGTLEFTGVAGMKHHYRDLIWPHFREVLDVRRFVSEPGTVAIQMHTDFLAREDNPDTLFGPVTQGDRFAYDGVIMYQLAPDGRFADILVAYNSFVFTGVDGTSRDLGVPH